MRIVGGQFRGRRLSAPASDAIRPTSDRLREAVFNTLQHGYGDPVSGARVMDLFAGTGALGLEAMSRGAEYCLFVETSAPARGLIRRNIEHLGLMGRTRLFRRDATQLGSARDHYDIVFADPPYGKGLADKALASLATGGWIKDGGLAIVEEAAASTFDLPPGFARVEQRGYGATNVHFLRFDAVTDVANV